MDPALLLLAAAAGAVYTLTPGPAFLAVLGIGVSQGRRASVGFLGGHLGTSGNPVTSTLWRDSMLA